MVIAGSCKLISKETAYSITIGVRYLFFSKSAI